MTGLRKLKIGNTILDEVYRRLKETIMISLERDELGCKWERKEAESVCRFCELGKSVWQNWNGSSMTVLRAFDVDGKLLNYINEYIR